MYLIMELYTEIYKEFLKLNNKKTTQFKNEWGLPGGPVAKSLLPNAGGRSSIPSQELERSHMPQ